MRKLDSVSGNKIARMRLSCFPLARLVMRSRLTYAAPPPKSYSPLGLMPK